MFSTCTKFKKLAGEQAERELSESQVEFLDSHRAQCQDCREYEASSFMSLNMLREATLEPEFNPNFEDRILRKLKVQTARSSIGYWSPAVVGAFVAGLAIVAALQLITRSADMPRMHFPGGEARNLAKPTNSLPFDPIISRSVDR